MDIIENLIQIRKKKGYSQDFMANNLGIENSNYSRIELKKTELTISRLVKIAEIFNMRLIDIITYPDIYENSDVNQTKTLKMFLEIELSETDLDIKDKLIDLIKNSK